MYELESQIFGPNFEERVAPMCDFIENNGYEGACAAMFESKDLFGGEPMSVKTLKHLS